MIDREVWKMVKGHRGMYEISNLGRARSYKRTRVRLLKPTVNYGGYYRIKLGKNNKFLYHTIHRLVASAFLKNVGNKKSINHKNGIKHDNKATNLEWCSDKENQQHAVLSGLNAKGEQHGRAKLLNADIIKIRGMFRSGTPFNVIAKRFDVSGVNIASICRRLSWKHI